MLHMNHHILDLHVNNVDSAGDKTCKYILGIRKKRKNWKILNSKR